MLILAGVTISVLNSAGILKNSQSAADKYEITDEQDVISVAFSTVFASSALSDSDITPEMLQRELNKTTRETSVTKSTDTGKENYLYVTFDKTKNKHLVDITNGRIDYVGPISSITGDWIKDAPISMEASPTTWTNKNVIVTIEYTIPEDKKIQADKVVLEYALSTAIKTWKKYEEPVVIEENMTIYARLNYLGETTEKPASLTITNIDKIEPTVAFTPNGGNTYTMPSAGNASLKAIPTVSDQGGSGVYSLSLQYIWSQSTTEPTNGWQSFTNATQVSKTDISAPGTWYLWTKYNDTARNNTGTEPKVTKSNAFVVKPNTDKDNEIILTANPTNWINGDVTVTVKYGANLTESRTLGCTGTNETDYTVNGTSNVIVKTNGKMVTATAKDAMGNMITASLTITNIDKIAPTVTFGTNGANNITMPTQGNATIKTTVTVSDTGGSGVCTSSLQYVWSQSTTAPTSGWTGFTNNTNITKNNITQAGTWYLWTKYNDNARNNTRTEPVVSRSNAFIIEENIKIKNRITLAANPAGWTKGDVTVTATYGANLTQNKTLGCTGTNGTDYTVNGTTNVIVKTNGKMVTATAKDAMGNMITASLTVTNIDKVAPATPSIVNPTNGNWTNRDFSLTVTSSDSQSGISYYQYSYDQANWTTYANSASNTFVTTPFIVERNQLAYIRCVDKAGNVSGVSSTYIRLDKTGPAKVTVDMHGYANGSWTNQNIRWTYNSSDSGSGIDHYEFLHEWNNATGRCDQEETFNTDQDMGPIKYRAVDKVGNAGPWSDACYRRIDKTAPSKTTVNLNGYASGSWTTGNVTQSFSATDSGSGVARYQYSHDAVNPIGDVPNPWVIDWDGEWNLYIRAIDNVGNIGPWSDVYTVRRHTHVYACYHHHTGSSGNGCYRGEERHWHSGSASSGGGCYGGINYHTHSGNETSGGACYQTEILHTHTGSEGKTANGCYQNRTSKKCGSKKTVNINHKNGKEWESCTWGCTVCKYSKKTITNGKCPQGLEVKWLTYGEDHANANQTCPNSITWYTLSCSKRVERYERSCSKTIDSYSLNCGYSDGQITGYYRNCGMNDGQLICSKR